MWGVEDDERGVRQGNGVTDRGQYGFIYLFILFYLPFQNVLDNSMCRLDFTTVLSLLRSKHNFTSYIFFNINCNSPSFVIFYF